MKKFEEPIVEVIGFVSEDIILTSSETCPRKDNYCVYGQAV